MKNLWIWNDCLRCYLHIKVDRFWSWTRDSRSWRFRKFSPLLEQKSKQLALEQTTRKQSQLTLFWLFSSFGTSFNLGGGVLGSTGGREGGEFDTLRFLMGGGIGGGVIFVELCKLKLFSNCYCFYFLRKQKLH